MVEPTYTIDRAVLTSASFNREFVNFNVWHGRLEVINLNNTQKFVVLYERSEHDGKYPAPQEEISQLRKLVYEVGPNMPPPVINITVAQELDQTLRFVSLNKIEKEKTEPKNMTRKPSW